MKREEEAKKGRGLKRRKEVKRRRQAKRKGREAKRNSGSNGKSSVRRRI